MTKLLKGSSGPKRMTSDYLPISAIFYFFHKIKDLNDDLLPKVDGRINGRDKQ